MRRAIIDNQNPFIGISHAGPQHGIRTRFALVCQKTGVLFGEGALVFTLQGSGIPGGLRAGEFVMQNRGARFIHDAQALFPESHAVVGFLVVGGFEDLVKAAKPLPHGSRRQQECGRAVVHIAAEHVHRGERIVAAPVTQAASVAPQNASGFLQHPVEQDHPSTYSSDIRAAFERSHGCGKRAGQQLRVIVEEQQMLPTRLLRRLVDGAQEMQILPIPDDVRPFDVLQQAWCVIR